MLTNEAIREIEDKALDTLLTAYEDEEAFSLPINIRGIANKFGLSLQEAVFDDKNIIGEYNRQKVTITIAKGIPYPQAIFTIAHEMGHFVLHKDQRDKEKFHRTDYINVDKADVPIEQEANCFAANLLMPRGVIYRWFKKTQDIETLRKAFGVSYSAMRLRLKTLDLTPSDYERSCESES